MFPKDIEILVVDDAPMARMLIKKILSSLGYEHVIEADDGSMAHKLILREDHDFGLILSDWQMNEMAGLELLKKVRLKKETSQVPFLLVSALQGDARFEDGIIDDYTDVLAKPFRPEELIAALTRLYSKICG